MRRDGIQLRAEGVRPIFPVLEPSAQPLADLALHFLAAMEGQDDHIRRCGFDGSLLYVQRLPEQGEPPQPGAG
jgi:hypothetical protein